jgi:hypothetical protein
MPTYSFRNIQTGVVEDKIMSMSSREEYLKENPNLETIITGAPGLVKSTGDRTKPPAGFKEVLSKISEANPTSSLANDYGKKDHTSVKVRDLVQKHREKAGGNITE